jgi:hypothetical protein
MLLLPSRLLFLLGLVLSAYAQTQLDWSIQGQRPPVARINQTWSWSLLPNTFSSVPTTNLFYSAQNLPPWAHFDPSTRTFSGYPPSGSEGLTWIPVFANSSDGTSAADGFFLQAVDSPSPRVNETFSQQLPRAFTLGPGYDSASYINELDESIRVPPGWSFSVGFEPWTFTDPDASPIFYTANEAGTARLPDWLTFDNGTVTFDGVAPHEAEGTRHEIIVFGSDYFGFGDVQQSLFIVIASHGFDLAEPLPAINATIRSDVNYTVPLENVKLDNATVTSSNVTIEVDLSNAPFLSYDSNSRLISGRLPTTLPNHTDINIPVHLRSPYGDNLTDTVTLHVIPDIFVSDNLPVLAIKPSRAFELDLKEYAACKDAAYAAVISPPQASNWMSFDADSMKLSGTAPKTKPDYDTTVDFSAFDPNTGIRDSSTLAVQYAPPDPKLNSGPGALSHGAKIALAIGLGVLGGLALLVGLFACCRRYRQPKQVPIHDDDATVCSEKDSVYEGKSRSVWLGGGKKGDKGIKGKKGFDDQEEVPKPHNIIVITDGLRATTYSPEFDQDKAMMTASSTFLRSSWGSKTSSSIFYSDVESGFDSPVAPSRKDAETTRSISTPRQRSDFRAIWEGRKPSSRHDLPTKDSSMSVLDPVPPSASSDSMRFDGLEVATATRQHVGPLTPAQKARMVDFGPERAVFCVNTPAPRSRLISQQGLVGRHASPEAAEVASPEPVFNSPSPGIRLVGDGYSTTTPSSQSTGRPLLRNTQAATTAAAAAATPPPSTPPNKKRNRSRTRTNSRPDLMRVTCTVGDPFHFTPVLNPPPAVAIGSPGRNGPPRTAHFAFLADADRRESSGKVPKPLPEWLHFDSSALEL